VVTGAFHVAEDFLAAGFAEAVRRRGTALDLIFVDLELAHVAIAVRSSGCAPTSCCRRAPPACRPGWEVFPGRPVCAGLRRLAPGELDGLCLFAPYLGNRMLIAEIAGAPGVGHWQPGELAETDEERRIWRYIKNRRTDPEPLYLGFGEDDRFAAAHGLLAATLAAESVDVIAGGHEWPPG